MIPQHDASRPDGGAYPRAFDSTRAPSQAAPQPPALSAAPDVMTFLDGLRRRWILTVLLGGTLGAIGAVAVFYLLTPGATAYTKIQVAFAEPHLATVHGTNDFKQALTTTAGEIVSKDVIRTALKDQAVRALSLEKLDPDPAQMIEDGLRTESKETSELLTVLFTHPDPKVALTVTKAISEAYFSTIVKDKKDQRVILITELEATYGREKGALENKMESMKRYEKGATGVDLAQWREERIDLMGRLKDERHNLSTLKIAHAKAKTDLESFELSFEAWKAKKDEPGAKGEKPDAAAMLDNALEADGDAKALRQRLASRKKLVDEYVKKGFKEYEYSKYADEIETIKAELAERRAELSKRVTEAIAAKEKEDASRTVPGRTTQDPEVARAILAKNVKAYAGLEKESADRVEELAKLAAKVPVIGPEYERDAAEVARDSLAVNNLHARIKLERMDLNARPRIMPAMKTAELLKVDTKKQLLATAATPVAILFAVAAGLAWLECGKRRVRKPGEISRGLGIRVVGAVPRQANLSKQLVGANGESELEGTPVMESIDAIRAALLHDADLRSTRTVLITSATSGEGKTTLAAALASSLARAGRKTLLLDGDLRRPSVHQLFEIPQQPGFSEVLLDEVELKDAAVETPLENLWVLPAGQWDREVLLALSRDGMPGVFEKLGEEFDFVLIDSHPVLEAADALLIGRQVDAVLLSVLSDVSQMPRVYAAQQQMMSLNIRVLGAVVNAASPEEALTAPQSAPVTV